MAVNYFDTMEDIDAKHIEDFNQVMGWFLELERQPKMSEIDYKAIDMRGRKANIELKTRYNNLNTFDKIFIETKKYQNLIHHWTYYKENPLYVNFFDDGIDFYVVVWDLKKIPNPETHVVKIFNKGKEKEEVVERFLLPLREATIYKKNNNEYEKIKLWADYQN